MTNNVSRRSNAVPQVTPNAVRDVTITSTAPAPTQPASCYATFDDWEHTTAWVSGYNCYTYTSTTVASKSPYPDLIPSSRTSHIHQFGELPS
jgi:hypothetical protein